MAGDGVEERISLVSGTKFDLEKAMGTEICVPNRGTPASTHPASCEIAQLAHNQIVSGCGAKG